MKNLFNGVLLLMAFSLGFGACTKDENKVYFQGGTAPVVASSITDSLTLLLDNANTNALTISWTNPDYNFNTGVSSQNVTYLLEIDTAGANFSSGAKKSYSILSDLNKSFTTSELNDVLVNTMKLAVDVPHGIEVRVTSSINKSATTNLVSNVVSFFVTPYDQPLSLSYLYVPGDYQGWSPPTAPQLGSGDSKLYEGYVYFSKDNTPFKFTSEPDWNGTNYGDGGGSMLSTDNGAGNLNLTGTAGVYKTNVDLPGLKWTATKTDWAIIGAATPGGWDNGTAMTYNAPDNAFEIASISLKADEFKFRANDSWDINLGGDTNGGSFLSYGGSNLKVNEAGNYKVILDLSHPTQYTYKLIKL